MRPETEDMQGWLKRTYLPRYEWGSTRYGDKNVVASTKSKLRNAAEETADLAFYLRQAIRDLEPQEGRLRVYIAGPYRAETPELVEQNVERAREVMYAILKKGHTPFCPHTMTGENPADMVVPPEVYIRTDMDWLPFCHVILLLAGWEDSEGATREYGRARELGLRLIEGVDELPLNVWY